MRDKVLEKSAMFFVFHCITTGNTCISIFRMILEPLFNLVVSISTTMVTAIFRYFFPKKENDEERSWKQYMVYTIYGIIGLSVLSITFLIHLGIGYFIHSGLSAGLRLQTEGLEFQVCQSTRSLYEISI